MLKKLIIDSSDGEFVVKTPTVKAKSFTGAERKFKGKEIVAIIKISEDEFMVFIEE